MAVLLDIIGYFLASYQYYKELPVCKCVQIWVFYFYNYIIIMHAFVMPISNKCRKKSNIFY